MPDKSRSSYSMELKKSNPHSMIIAIIIGAIIIAVGLALGLGFGLRLKQKCGSSAESDDFVYKSASEEYMYAAVVADTKIASDIGNDILARKGGNAVDAAVATTFASCLLSAHSCGIGGGSFIVIYDKISGWHAIDGRETAPLSASEGMYASQENRNKSLIGGMAVGIPGEVKCLYEIHQRFGRIPWKEVVIPSVKLCEQGVPITKAIYKALHRFHTPKQKEQFFEYFDSNQEVKPVGTPVQLLKLARTFQAIAEDPMSFYNGRLAQYIVNDIVEAGGIITLDDLRNYTVKWTDPSIMTLPGNISVYSMPPPGSGPVLGYILNILSGYKFGPASIATEADSILTHHRIVEAMKFAYGKRTELGDAAFVDVTTLVKNMQSLAYGEATRKKISDTKTQDTLYYKPAYQMKNDQGTGHVSVIDAQGNAVSITSTINTHFGSGVKGNLTGIIFNNEMDDFSTPNTTNYFQLAASPANFIEPGKRPMSSMCPAIVFDHNSGNVKLVTGAAGGSKITTATALNIIDVLWFGLPLPASIDRPRLHHQLVPVEIQVEDGYPKAILDGLIAKGHKIRSMRGISVIQAAHVLHNGILAAADFRKGGAPSGY